MVYFYPCSKIAVVSNFRGSFTVTVGRITESFGWSEEDQGNPQINSAQAFERTNERVSRLRWRRWWWWSLPIVAIQPTSESLLGATKMKKKFQTSSSCVNCIISMSNARQKPQKLWPSHYWQLARFTRKFHSNPGPTKKPRREKQ